MASERLNMLIFFTVMVIAGAAMQMQSTDAQKTHNVGGSIGWTINPKTPYTTWASSQTFKVGDTLVFNFTTGAHTAAEVTKAAYDACTIANPITVWSTGPSSVKLNSSGPHYYLCTVPSHCTLGQKLAITVAAATTPPSQASAPSPTSSTSPPTGTPEPGSTPSAPEPGSSSTPSAPAPSSAPSFVATALPLTFLSAAIMALVY